MSETDPKNKSDEARELLRQALVKSHTQGMIDGWETLRQALTKDPDHMPVTLRAGVNHVLHLLDIVIEERKNR